MLFMIIERFKNGDARPVYERFRERGRMAPDGLHYVSSWVDTTLGSCYQVMETADRSLFDQWIRHWNDLVDSPAGSDRSDDGLVTTRDVLASVSVGFDTAFGGGHGGQLRDDGRCRQSR